MLCIFLQMDNDIAERKWGMMMDNNESCETCQYRANDTICSIWDDLIYTWCFMYTPRSEVSE